jgi:tRNA(Ile)-lysidine synthase
MRGKLDWKACAERLSVEIPKRRLHPGVIEWIDQQARRGSWGVAFSGGADSTALLLILWALWPERRRHLVALHFNHRLRGSAANQDEIFCRRVARGLDVRFQFARWTARPKKSGEAEAREARHAFFRRELRAAKSRLLWLGHQQDDIAETLLMRVARGSGTSGLSAPRPVQSIDRRVHLRPLLTLKKSEIESALRAVGAEWRVDASNETPRFLRNRMRRDVIPSWMRASEGRDVLAGAALARELLEEDDLALESWLTELNPFFEDGALDLGKIAGRPKGLARRALHTWLARHAPKVALSRQAVNLLLDDVLKMRSTRHSLGVAGFACIRKSRLFFERRSRKVSN